MVEVWRSSEVFFKGLVRYGSQVQELRLRQSLVDPVDMTWAARHCARLKVLDLTNTDVTVDVLRHLINRDPYNILSPERSSARLFNLEEEDENEDMNASPQLKSLSLQGFPGVTDEILIELIRHCPNIVELKLFGHSLKDKFMRIYAQKLTPTTPPRKTPRRLLERLEVDRTDTTSKGIAPLIKACRSKMWNLRISRSVTIKGEILYELLDNPHHKDAQPVEVKPGLTRTFAPNTVLTEVHLTYSKLINDTAAGILFRYATELRIVDLEACYVEDGCLLELAATYRNRMQRLGLGVPAAWREHELALERVPYVERNTYGEDEGAASASASTKTQNTATSIPIPKIFSGTTVPGGLISLSITSCEWITNRGVRAIVRSCAGLRTLNLGYGTLTSAELFHGPWACTQLVTLDIKCLPLQGSSIEQPRLKLEEDDERLRFPLAIDVEQGDEDDFGEDDSYDYIVYPDWEELAYLSEEENSSTDQDNEGSEGQTDANPHQQTYLESALEVQEPEYRNTPLQRALLRTFYARLGQLQHLQSLDMSCKFRVRVRDGLDLVLPGLRHSLASWNLSRDKEYKMKEEELTWIGKHFGYGYEYTEDASEREEQRGRQTGLQRLSKLKAVQVYPSNVSKVRLNLFDWLKDQSILIEMTQPA
ncbi:hypothetical protein BG011_006022 [Mortierella polycephala]|uniref:RNI-like protein n=1 Tax=Mortierella polycephala TaxID=41804 RepID=A0A9P6U055_9FUNG|nr:hypothetical protein BG011_006022 [Mortierella polycephala]